MFDFYRQINNWQDQNPIRGSKVFYDSTHKNIRIDGATDFIVSEADGDFLVNRDATIRGNIVVNRTVFAKNLEYERIHVQDTTVKQDLRVERRLFVGDSLSIENDLFVRDDATIKGDLHFDGQILQNGSPFVSGGGLSNYSSPIFQDTTVKDDLRVEGLIFGTLADLPSPAAHDHNYTDPIFDDATVKDDIRIEGLIFGTLADAPTPAAHDHNYTDPVFDDATVKDDLVVEGLIFGTLADAAVAGEAQDFKVFKDLVVQDDATVKDRLFLESGFGGGMIPGLTMLCHLYICEHLRTRDATVKQTLRVEGYTEIKHLHVYGNHLRVRGDATIKQKLWVEGYSHLGGNLHVYGNEVKIRGDATIKGELRVEGYSDLRNLQVYEKLVIKGDTTAKGNFYADKIYIEEIDIEEGPLHFEQGNIVINKDAWIRNALVVQADATVKDDLRVEGLIFGTLADEPIVTEAQDFKIHKDLIVQDDATIKDDLRIEGSLDVLGNMFFTLDDLFVSGDATIKGTLIVDKILKADVIEYKREVVQDTTTKGDLHVDGRTRTRRLHVFGIDPAVSLEVQGFTLLQDDLLIYDDATIKGDLLVEGSATYNTQSLFVQGDATIKDDLFVDGLIFGTLADAPTPAAHDHNYTDPIFNDTTVKNNIRVEGEIVGYSLDGHTHTGVYSPVGHDHNYSSPIFQDTTVKDDLRVEGLIFGTLADAPTPAAHDHNYTDPVFDDATVKDDLRVEGLIFGTLANQEALDFKIYKDLIVQDDATVKDDLIVEGLIFGTPSTRFYEIQDSTTGQTRVYLSSPYPGNNYLMVFVNGTLQRIAESYTEEANNAIVFTEALQHNDKLAFISY